jgi:hypothetical protein
LRRYLGTRNGRLGGSLHVSGPVIFAAPLNTLSIVKLRAENLDTTGESTNPAEQSNRGDKIREKR